MIPWIVACQAPLSMGHPRQEYWGGLPFPSPEDLPDPGIELGSPALQADSLPPKPHREITEACSSFAKADTNSLSIIRTF